MQGLAETFLRCLRFLDMSLHLPGRSLHYPDRILQYLKQSFSTSDGSIVHGLDSKVSNTHTVEPSISWLELTIRELTSKVPKPGSTIPAVPQKKALQYLGWARGTWARPQST